MDPHAPNSPSLGIAEFFFPSRAAPPGSIWHLLQHFQHEFAGPNRPGQHCLFPRSLTRNRNKKEKSDTGIFHYKGLIND
jgi:hypothetical protein